MKNAILIRNAASTDFGGGEKIPVYIAREISKQNINSYVFSSSKKLLNFAKEQNVNYKKTWWWSWQNWSGPKVILTPIYFVWQIILTIYYLVLFAQYKPSVVHLQSKDDFIAGTVAARLYGAKVIWSDYADLKHVWKNVTIWYKNPIGKAVLWASRFTSEILVVSREDLRLISVNLPTNMVLRKMSVVYNGAFDTHITPPARLDTDPLTFISTARLVTDKGINELIDAFEKLKNHYPNVQLTIVGDGPERATFQQKAETIPGITFVGHTSNPVEYLSKAQVFVLPTYHEGFSVALVEACMQGLAIITTQVGGNLEIIKGNYNGILIPTKDTEALYNAMNSLVLDANMRNTLGTNARLVYEKDFNFETIITNQFVPRYSS